jgi:hypothetical protein
MNSGKHKDTPSQQDVTERRVHFPKGEALHKYIQAVISVGEVRRGSWSFVVTTMEKFKAMEGRYL